MARKLDAALNFIVVGCAIVITGLVVRREIFPPESPGSVAPRPVLVPNWRQYAALGERLGPSDAPLHLVVFSDFQCPFCARLHRDLRQVRARYPEKIALTYLHFPLQSHTFSEPAARAAECARAQERSESMHDVLFSHQRELGRKPWVELATEARVTDIAAFDSCMSSQTPLDRIEQSRRSADELRLKGTPTVIVNGWMLPTPPTVKDIDDMLERVASGNTPVKISG